MGVKLGLSRAAWWGAALLLCACPSDEGAPPAPIEEVDASFPRSDGGTRDSGRDTGTSTDASGDAATSTDASGDAASSLGPLLELLEPGEDSVIVGSTLNARCRVERNPDGEPVNPGSVKVALYAEEETVALVTQVATSTSEANVFKADVPLASAPHGAVRVECSAEDMAQQKHSSTLSVSALVDRGPLITFLYPSENGFVPAGDGAGEDVRVRFKVEPRPLSDDDEGAEVDDISVTVAGRPISGIEESSTEEHVYSFGLDFADETMFTVIPETLSIRVEARNVRDPAATATANLAVGVDSEGPTIAVKSPVSATGAEPIVSGKVDIVLEVKDELAGVDAPTVEMVIKLPNGTERRYPAELVGNGQYTASFEVGEYPDSSGLTLNFYATDLVGIKTTASLGVRIDDRPPWLSLVPHNVRERSVKTASASDDECSGSFDPLGNKSPNDGQTVQKAVRLRTIAWDRARRVSGQDILWHSMVDQNSVDLVVQHDTRVPLLINSRGILGGPCDAVNLRPAGGATAPIVVELDALTPAGAAPLAGEFVGTMPPVFVPDLTSDPNVSAYCVPKQGSLPPIICQDPDMPRIIKHDVVGAFPVVFGINVTTTFCSGDSYPNPTPGPMCVVAQARDNAGNSAFSWPIRLCVEYAPGEDNVVTCPEDTVDGITSALDGITCTDGCVLPPDFGPDAPDRMPDVLRLD